MDLTNRFLPPTLPLRGGREMMKPLIKVPWVFIHNKSKSIFQSESERKGWSLYNCVKISCVRFHFALKFYGLPRNVSQSYITPSVMQRGSNPPSSPSVASRTDFFKGGHPLPL